MPTIAKNIALEQFRTRFPVCFPAIDGDGEVSYISDLLHQDSAHYGMIPLSLSSGVTGSFSEFTEEMQEKYSGSVFPCYTLQSWLDEFIAYFDTLKSLGCRVPFMSMSAYSESVYGYVSTAAADADALFNEHGGFKFYKWLVDNYFVMFDCWFELEDVFSQDYDRIAEIVANLGCERIPYPAALKLYGRMKDWMEKFSGVDDCNKLDDCCDCETYFSYGGDDMVEALESWLETIEGNMVHNDSVISGDTELMNSLIPRISLDVPITNKMEDFGVFEIMAVDFVPGRMYEEGEVCIYDNDVWICVSDNGYESDEFSPEVGGVTIWRTFYEYSGKTIYDTSSYVNISGRTVSSLSSFSLAGQTNDNLGNALPGNFTPFSGSTVIQPPEGTLLDFPYLPGTVSNESIAVDNGSVMTNIYSGDYLERIVFFAKDSEGDVISATTRTCEINSDTPNESIQGTVLAAESYSGYTDGKIYADFVYIKGAEYQYVNSGEGVSVSASTPYLECTDHCTLEEATCQYWLSEKESYPVKYWKVDFDVEEVYSEEKRTTTDVCMCDFSTVSGYTWQKENGFMSPVFRKEEMLWFSHKETPKDNIYINRGYATVLDRHLRIGEAFNYEQLEKYGNGMFQIFNADEDTI